MLERLSSVSARRALLLNTRLGNVNSYLTLLVAEGLAAVLGEANVLVTDYHRAVEDARRHAPDFVVFFDGQGIDRVFVAKLRALAPRLVLWLTEDPYEFKRHRALVEHFDIVFTNDLSSAAKYEDACVQHLPLAASPTIHGRAIRDDESSYLYDFFFAGVAWPNRARFFRALLPMLGGLHGRLILPHNEFVRPPSVGLLDFEINQRISNGDLATLHNLSRVVIHLDRDFSASGNVSRASTPGPRLFEGALAGSLQLVPADATEIARYFEPNREVVTYESVQRCAELVRFYVTHSEERRAIARAAQQRAEQHHLYEHRARSIVEAVAALERTQPRSVTTLPGSGSSPATVLHVLHNGLGTGHFGGTELHVDATERSLPERFRTLLLHPDVDAPERNRLLLEKREADRNVKEWITIGAPLRPRAVNDVERELAFAKLLERERIDLVHFFHLLHHPLSLIEVAKRHGARVVVTLPDHYAVCPRFTLLDADERCCWNGPPPLASCDIDLERTERLVFGSQARRRAAVGRLLGLADVILCLSQSQREILLSVYPHLSERSRVLEWGIDPEPFAPKRRPAREGSPIRIGAVGNFTKAKGADPLIYVFNYFRGDERVRFSVHGRLDAPYDAILRQLALPNVEIAGRYLPEELPARLRELDVALLASVWPETYVLALSECWAAGVVPIGSDIGALGERITDGVDGLKVPFASAGHLSQTIERLLSDRALLERLRDGVSRKRVRTTAEATSEYASLYDALLQGRASAAIPAETLKVVQPLPSRFPLCTEVWGYTADNVPTTSPGASLTLPDPRSIEVPAPLLAWAAAGVRVSAEQRPAGILSNGHNGAPERVREIFDPVELGTTWQADGCELDDADGWMVCTSRDPKLESRALDLDWSEVDAVLIDLAALAFNSHAGGQLFWCSHADGMFEEEYSLRFIVRCDGKMHQYVLRPHVDDRLRRRSSIRFLRFDPIDLQGEFLLQRIAIQLRRRPWTRRAIELVRASAHKRGSS